MGGSGLPPVVLYSLPGKKSLGYLPDAGIHFCAFRLLGEALGEALEEALGEALGEAPGGGPGEGTWGKP